MTLLYRNRYRVPSARRVGWDYRWASVYSVTVNTRYRERSLSEVVGKDVVLSPLGRIVEEEWQRIPVRHPHVTLDSSVIMPDHFHGILIFGRLPGIGPVPKSTLAADSLGAVVGQLKSKSTKRIRALGHRTFAWQERFFDQILPDLQALEAMRMYIKNNPESWGQE
jgi:putative transposase